MERTPSPPRRVRTPPAPLHGPKYDSYEPFSPRRSSRVAAQQSSHLHLEQTASPPRKRITRDVTPTSSRQQKAAIVRNAHFALSPPNSPPTSPAKARSPRSTRRTQPATAVLDSDSDTLAPTPARRLLSVMAPENTLLTPAKTPRKRAMHTEESLRPTARVLFTNRASTVEDAMPSPRKVHKRTRSALDLGSFEDRMDTDSHKIGVYVDSKDRVPDREDEENNPFVTRRGKGKGKALPKKPRKMDEKTAKIFEAAARDEGIVYTHRGKTIFRQFDDVSGSDAGPASDDEMHLKADRNGPGRITRSSVKPKLLFKEEIQQLYGENGEEDDEEAPTDIELPIASVDTPSRKKRHDPSMPAAQEQESSSPLPVPTVKRRLSVGSPFGSFARVKSSSRPGSAARGGTKRVGTDSPLEQPAKRARSEHSSPMSVDSF